MVVAEAPAERQVGAGPSLPRQEPWLDLPPEEFAGFRARCWLGFSNATWQAASGSDGAGRVAALRQIVREHNGWCDEDGTAYPPADSDEFWSAIPLRLAVVLVAVVSQALYATPLSMKRPRG